MSETSFTVEILPDGTKVRARAGEILADVLVRAGIPLSLYCHERGVCGKCAVRILSGPLPFPAAVEASLLEARGLGPDHRLACLYVVRSDVTVETLPGSRLERIPVLDTGLASSAFVDPAVTKLSLILEKPSLFAPVAAADSLRAQLKSPDLILPLAALSKLGAQALGPSHALAAILYDDRELLDIEPDEAGRDIFGLAVDLGTTSIAAELVDLRTGRIADRTAAVNAQSSYGADVVSRITFAFENPDNLRRLRTAAVQLINDMVGTMSRRSGVPRHRIYDAVVAGNTAMNHILCGVAVDSMALAPFHAVFSRLPPLAVSEIGFALHPQARVYISPNIKSFVGGDGRPGLRGHEHQLRHARRARGHPPGRMGQRLQVPDGRRPAAPGRLRLGPHRYPGRGHRPGPDGPRRPYHRAGEASPADRAPGPDPAGRPGHPAGRGRRPQRGPAHAPRVPPERRRPRPHSGGRGLRQLARHRQRPGPGSPAGPRPGEDHFHRQRLPRRGPSPAHLPAGPAFEGMNISCGMLAVPGAIHRVEWDNGFKC
ncbi:MAG: ferredoxin, partial [Candidatus Aminicenantes bacterium]|nr:ferredoxin [Candidatus Aminicenantes bacterium]